MIPVAVTMMVTMKMGAMMIILFVFVTAAAIIICSTIIHVRTQLVVVCILAVLHTVLDRMRMPHEGFYTDAHGFHARDSSSLLALV